MALPKELALSLVIISTEQVAYGQHGTVNLFFDNTWSWVFVAVLRYSISLGLIHDYLLRCDTAV